MNRKRFFSVLILAFMLTLLSGALHAQEEIVITVWTRSETILSAFEAYNEALAEAGSNVRVDYTRVLPEEFPAKFTAALSAGEAPDVVSIDLILVPYYNSIGAFLDLTDRLADYEYKDELNQAMLNLGTWDGKVYALPFSADDSALIYNRTLFEEAGLDPDKPPTTWAELVEYARTLTDPEKGVYGYGFSGGSAGGLMFTMMPYAWANGGLWLSEDGMTAAVNDPRTVEAVQMFVDMINEGLVPPGTPTYTYDDFQNGFKQGQIAMITTGNFVVSDLVRNFPDIDFGVALIPGQDGESFSSFIGGDLIAIPATSRYPDEAWEFIKFLLSEDVQIEVYAKNGIIPVRRDLHENEYFEAEPRYKVFAQALEVGYVPFTVVYNELYNPFLAGMQNAFLGNMSVEEALTQAAAEMQIVIDRAAN